MRSQFLFNIILVILLVGCSAQRAPASDRVSITLTECVLSSPRIETQVDAECGSLAVPEDPSNPEGRQIPLSIAVVPAITRSPEPDPLFILVGGPGQSAIETFPALSATVFRIHEQRDIVLVDQRGTGESNPLRCLDPAADEILEDDRLIALLQACPERLDADLRFYTTDIAMQDLDRVRSLLGYERVNLFGVSYGTRAALTYLKLYPERVRSIILDAVVDPGFILYQDAARDGQEALDQFFARCEADEACSTIFPGLRAEFDSILQRLEAGPLEVTITHPVTGRPLDLEVTRATFTNIIFNTLYSPDLIAMLPMAIHQAYTEENYGPLISQAYLVDAGIYDGMFYAVACTEDAPLVSAPDDEEALFGNTVHIFLEVCSAWPKGNPAEIVRAPVDSDVPILMLSGEADPITPPRHAERLAPSLGSSLHLVFDDMGHGNSASQCTAKILDDFVERASIADLDTGCVERVEPPPFFVDFSGPQP